MAIYRKWGFVHFFSVIRFPKSGCLIVAKLKGGNWKALGRGVAGIFSWATQFLKFLSTAPRPFKSGSYCSVFFHHQPNDTICCMLQARSKKFEKKALKVAWWFDIIGRKACRYRGSAETSSPGKVWKFEYVLMPFVAFKNPLRSVQNPTRTNRFPFRN